ncbi:hypothetical protein [Natranaerofaba carboxydovora]|uniref:hypothetical protein n=1 Tax=Natranaerofaba carboxydovora TaxID=2742683 RepID=UPI001F14795F|nr:hypothetical protein [Natranaerofaba carboxydovora]UMZ74976.1 hypothetical protein ACONDI_02582 [Natranaerofaba carboxydovora]
MAEKIKKEVFMPLKSQLKSLPAEEAPHKAEERLARKRLYDKVLEVLDGSSKNVLEVKCGEGIISRNIGDLGFFSMGMDKDREKLKKATRLGPRTGFMEEDLSEENIENLPDFDVILFLPEDSSWFMKKTPETIQNIITGLSSKAKKQFIFQMPKKLSTNMPKGSKKKEKYDKLFNNIKTSINFKGELKLNQSLKGEPKEMEMLVYSSIVEEQKVGMETKDVNKDTEKGIDKDINVVPKGLESLDTNSMIVEVELDKCCDRIAFSYSPKGWHYLSALLWQYTKEREKDQEQQLEYKNSMLKKYYDTFHPSCLQEVYFPDMNEKMPPLDKGWPELPWEGPGYRYRKLEIFNPDLNVWQHFGPVTEAYGRKEFDRTIKAFHSIEREGYQPEIHPDGYILGFFLKKGDEYTFMVTGGQHRAGSIAVLNYETFRAKFAPGRKPVIDIDEIEEWPNVKNGLYSREVATKVFEHYFYTNSLDKAKYFGFI